MLLVFVIYEEEVEKKILKYLELPGVMEKN
jgi:hypothetical protein